jgi:hypothetical protein
MPGCADDGKSLTGLEGLAPQVGFEPGISLLRQTEWIRIVGGKVAYARSSGPLPSN